jgi:hypothetical protein
LFSAFLKFIAKIVKILLTIVIEFDPTIIPGFGERLKAIDDVIIIRVEGSFNADIKINSSNVVFIEVDGDILM